MQTTRAQRPHDFEESTARLCLVDRKHESMGSDRSDPIDSHAMINAGASFWEKVAPNFLCIGELGGDLPPKDDEAVIHGVMERST